jgi:3D (Asp-Asp-Asp) domain-containing protein
MLNSRSLRRKLVATALAASGFVLIYEATVIDSKKASTAPAEDTAPPVAGARLRFVATAYCRGRTTASGVSVTTGIVAADKTLLPEGSVIEVNGTLDASRSIPEKYRGIYTVMDTGPMVRGRHIDVYLWNCDESVTFGRRDTMITVLRLGWHPKNTRPGTN